MTTNFTPRSALEALGAAEGKGAGLAIDPAAPAVVREAFGALARGGYVAVVGASGEGFGADCPCMMKLTEKGREALGSAVGNRGPVPSRSGAFLLDGEAAVGTTRDPDGFFTAEEAFFPNPGHESEWIDLRDGIAKFGRYIGRRRVMTPTGVLLAKVWFIPKAAIEGEGEWIPKEIADAGRDAIYGGRGFFLLQPMKASGGGFGTVGEDDDDVGNDDLDDLGKKKSKKSKKGKKRPAGCKAKFVAKVNGKIVGRFVTKAEAVKAVKIVKGLLAAKTCPAPGEAPAPVEAEEEVVEFTEEEADAADEAEDEEEVGDVDLGDGIGSIFFPTLPAGWARIDRRTTKMLYGWQDERGPTLTVVSHAYAGKPIPKRTIRAAAKEFEDLRFQHPWPTIDDRHLATLAKRLHRIAR